jgi:hypothetical protein
LRQEEGSAVRQGKLSRDALAHDFEGHRDGARRHREAVLDRIVEVVGVGGNAMQGVGEPAVGHQARAQRTVQPVTPALPQQAVR